jgi:hypothetical protein
MNAVLNSSYRPVNDSFCDALSACAAEQPRQLNARVIRAHECLADEEGVDVVLAH